MDSSVNFRYSLNVDGDVWAPLAHPFKRSFAAMTGYNVAMYCLSDFWRMEHFRAFRKCYDGKQEAQKTLAPIALQTSVHDQNPLTLIPRNSLFDPQTSYPTKAITYGGIQWRQHFSGEIASGVRGFWGLAEVPRS